MQSTDLVGLVVLMIGPRLKSVMPGQSAGVVVAAPDHTYTQIGYYSEQWNLDTFEVLPMGSTVTITQ